jgi:hypothetical protein
MMKLDIITLCRMAFCEGSRLSISDAVDSVYAPSLPFKYPNVTVALRARFSEYDGDEHKVSVQVFDTDGVALGRRGEFPVRLPPKCYQRIVTLCMSHRTGEIQLKSYGPHEIHVYLDEELVSVTPFDVRDAPLETLERGDEPE